MPPGCPVTDRTPLVSRHISYGFIIPEAINTGNSSLKSGILIGGRLASAYLMESDLLAVYEELLTYWLNSNEK